MPDIAEFITVDTPLDDLAPIHIPHPRGLTDGTTITVGQQRAWIGEQLRHREDAERWRARTARIAAEQAAAEQAERDRQAAELAAAEAVPDSGEIDPAEIDADPEVAALEERIASGDTKVTEAQLAKVRTEAAGRVRFVRLRGKFAERKARKDAEQLERVQAAAAEQHAREALAGHLDADLAPLQDEAVRAVAALVQAVEGRNATLRRLVHLPAAQRVRGAATSTGGGRLGSPDMVPLPEGRILPIPVDALIGQVTSRATEKARAQDGDTAA